MSDNPDKYQNDETDSRTPDNPAVIPAGESKEEIKKLNAIFIHAILVGLLTGLVGTSFRLLVTRIIQARQALSASLEDNIYGNYAITAALAGSMVFLAFWLMKKFAPDTGGSGIPRIEGFLKGVFRLNWRRVLPIKFLGGLLTLGSGMILGREGPTIQMGGAIGRMVGDIFRTTKEDTRILVASGAGAGLSTAFNAPLAGVIFVIEEMQPTFKDPIISIHSIILACVVATVSTRIMVGQEPVMKLTHFGITPLNTLWIFALLGVFTGLIGYLFNMFLVKALNWFSSLGGRTARAMPFLIGAVFGVLGLVYFPVTGGGDDTVIWAFDTKIPAYMILMVFTIRFLLTMISYGSGAPGGIFAPMLALATILSLGVAMQVHDFFPEFLPEPGILAVAGMGSLVAATVRAPLTAIILTVEMTDNYMLILPLLITSLTASMVADKLGGEPIYSILLERSLDKN